MVRNFISINLILDWTVEKEQSGLQDRSRSVSARNGLIVTKISTLFAVTSVAPAGSGSTPVTPRCASTSRWRATRNRSTWSASDRSRRSRSRSHSHSWATAAVPPIRRRSACRRPRPLRPCPPLRQRPCSPASISRWMDCTQSNHQRSAAGGQSDRVCLRRPQRQSFWTTTPMYTIGWNGRATETTVSSWTRQPSTSESTHIHT